MDGPELSFSQVFVMVAFVVSCEMTRHNKREGKKQDSFHGRTTGIRVYSAGCTRVKNDCAAPARR